MAAWTDRTENETLDWILRNVAKTMSTATLHIGLFTTAPTDSTFGVECTGAGYVRIPVTWSAPAAGITDNTGVLTFGPPTGTWGALTSWGLLNHVSTASGANTLIAYGPLTQATPASPVGGDTVAFAAGALDFTTDTAAGNMTDTMEDAMVNYWMRAQATALDFNLIVSTNVYLSLHVTPAQTDTSGSTGEFTGGASPGYARATIARGTGTFGASAAGTITNSALAITWPEASAPWQAIVGMGLWDTLTGGSKLFYSNPLSPPTIGSGQTLRIGTSQTTLTIE